MAAISIFSKGVITGNSPNYTVHIYALIVALEEKKVHNMCCTHTVWNMKNKPLLSA